VSTIPEGIEASPAVLAKYEQFGGSYRWWVTCIAMLGSFATLLSATVINVAIPDMMGSLGMSPDEAQWLATAFLAAGTITMLMNTWLIRVLGIAGTFSLGLSIFVISSFAGAVAQNTEMLLLTRAVQGAAAGVVQPISMLLIAQVFPVRSRGLAMGLMGVGTILAPALGPTLGGFLVDNLSWRWVFIAPIPAVLPAILLAFVFFPGREAQTERPTFDWEGLALAATYIIAFLIGLTRLQREGVYDPDAAVWLVVGGLAFVGWVLWELRSPDPLLDLRLFTNVRFTAAATVTFIFGGVLYSSTYVFPLYTQYVSRLIPTDSGLIMAPAGLVMAVLFPICGYLSDIATPRRMIVTGLLIFAASNIPMAYADAMTPISQLVGWYVLGRIGMACLFPSLNAVCMNALPLHLMPHGSACVNFMRQLGGAFGVNLMVMFVTRREAVHLDHVSATQNWANHSTMEQLRLAQEQLAQLGQIGYQSFEMSFGFVMQSVSTLSTMLAYRDAFWLITLITLVTVVPAWFSGSAPGGRLVSETSR
jgi:EmrB/QacA subfamily drug resistance transporter